MAVSGGARHYRHTWLGRSGSPWGAADGVGCVLCVEAQCERGARCEDVRNSYACACPAGYAGDYCQHDVDECADHRCRHGATCRDGVAAYDCLCAAGYDGQFCEHDIDECASAPCENGGTCWDEPGAFRCECGDEWRGARCELPRVRTCAHRPCAPHATCADVPDTAHGNNYTCACADGWEGVHCELAFCDVTPCLNGQCNSELQAPECACAPGWSGRLCGEARDECAGAAACLHGGRCVPARRPPECACPPEWRGARCEEDVDECAEGTGSCGPGQCVNTPGGYACECPEGLCGHGCALADPCYETPAPQASTEGPAEEADERHGPCQHGGRCQQRCGADAAYECACAAGWGGANCTQQGVSAQGGALGPAARWALGAGGALVALALGGAALAALAAQARRKRATRGTYSPSGQEYCNPRAEMLAHALKPPPEERLI
ncbi:protein crumbs-like [Pararge aegeria]|uniref:protein crumbs-like n=1 Tax=Pararge aegeria TaxID=116150 RepID=UPI0019D162C2|nr:protein crumbs-like [Pararge aegeria]